jgi:hypothetical protein
LSHLVNDEIFKLDFAITDAVTKASEIFMDVLDDGLRRLTRENMIENKSIVWIA